VDTNRGNQASTAIRVGFKKIITAKTDFAHRDQELDITRCNAKRNKFVARARARCGGGAPLAAQACVCHGASSRRAARNARTRNFSGERLKCCVCFFEPPMNASLWPGRRVRRFRGGGKPCRNKSGWLFCGGVVRRRFCGFPQSRVVIARAPFSPIGDDSDISDAVVPSIAGAE
jgi:hypothetical protein